MAEDIKKENQEENLVKKTCRELGITQKELAEIIGVSRQTISDWATEKTVIPKIGINMLGLLLIKRDYLKLKEVLKHNIEINSVL